MLKLRRVELSAWPELSAGLDVLPCQTPQWLRFLELSQGAEPVLAEVHDGGERLGFFTGAMLRRFGLRILGSPLRGWTTSYMGFAMRDGVPRAEAITALERFAFGELRCAHLELMDREAVRVDYGAGWQGRDLHGYEIDLTQSEEQLFTNMDPACRRAIRKAEKDGVVVEEATDFSGFAAEYHAQLSDVFARQELRPPYPQRRVEQLIEALHPDGMLVLLRASDQDGRCLATAVFPGWSADVPSAGARPSRSPCGPEGRAPMMYFWGGASWRELRGSRPNEALMWEAMRRWKARGAARFDMGGAGEYKAKYGGTQIAMPWMRKSSNAAVALLRTGVERAVAWGRRR